MLTSKAFPFASESASESARAVRVAVTVSVHRTYTYSLPPAMEKAALPGCRVLVPFGRRILTGYILERVPPPPRIRLKHVLDVLDEAPLFGENLQKLFLWAAGYYQYPVGRVIQSALPAGLTLKDRVEWSVTEAGRRVHARGRGSPVWMKILEALADGAQSTKFLSKMVGKVGLSTVLRRMEAEGLLLRENRLEGGGVRPRTEKFAELIVSSGSGNDLEAGPEISPAGKISESRRRLIDLLRDAGEVPVSRLRKAVPGAPGILRRMADAGMIRLEERPVWRDPLGDPVAPDRPHALNDEQRAAVDAVESARSGGFRAFLLAGVTGSGKTEVYLQLSGRVMDSGDTVLVLVPEIALISQTERCFRARFGDRIAVLHSGLSDGERYDQWRRIKNRETPIVIGARSAVFAPLDRIGLIVVDEEHDPSYKQGADLLYNARDLAVVRGRMENAAVVLGSATPSVQSWFNTRIRKFSALHLTKRATARSLPHVRIVDMRSAREERGARRLITPDLHGALRETLDRGEQALLFLNRRGFASFPVCAACGEAVTCRHCELTLTYHRLSEQYRCHMCGFSLPAAAGCPSCKSPSVKLMGIGTEKVEKAVRTLFPDAGVARMDRDTTSRRGSVVKILKAVRNRAIDILVGTQMIAKGHDFPGITLVGVICADLSLSFPDFRASERTFQLLAQVAGRAGRGDRPGRVILQTYLPDHFSIQAACSQDFQIFYNTEIGFRRALGYPPATRLIHIRISGGSAGRAGEVAAGIGQVLMAAAKAPPETGEKSGAPAFMVMGPVEAAIPRIADRFRYQILLKGDRPALMRRAVESAREAHPNLFGAAGVSVVVDVDPYFMM
ncbi:MAG: primosomal protein N' [Desulfobacterales bacterium]|nr:MAG: primosomal protein N' [Desulfobacterales bacterium]